MPRRLVFHFFISDDYEANIMYKVHFACLKYFANVFDEAVFILTSNNERAPYDDVESKLLNIFRGKRITIQIHKNDALCEATTFYNEVVEKNESVLTFFFHTKGVRDITCNIGESENIIQWVLMIYYYSLNNIESVEGCLLFEAYCIFYGSCRGYVKETNLFLPNRSTFYLGSGYWINNERLLQVGVIPKIMDRWYCENFPIYYDEKYKGSYKNYYCLMHNFYYGNNDEMVNIYEENDENGIRMFNNFKKNILNGINE